MRKRAGADSSNANTKAVLSPSVSSEAVTTNIDEPSNKKDGNHRLRKKLT